MVKKIVCGFAVLFFLFRYDVMAFDEPSQPNLKVKGLHIGMPFDAAVKIVSKYLPAEVGAITKPNSYFGITCNKAKRVPGQSDGIIFAENGKVSTIQLTGDCINLVDIMFNSRELSFDEFVKLFEESYKIKLVKLEGGNYQHKSPHGYEVWIQMPSYASWVYRSIVIRKIPSKSELGFD